MFKILQKAIKYRYLLLWLIAFFIGGILYPLTCKAQALPTPSANTLSVIEGGNSSLTYNAFSTIDALPINKDPVTLNRIIGVASQNPLVLGTQLNTLGIDDYTIRELTESEKDDILSSEYDTFYDINGNIVDIDDVYYMSYINSMFHGKLYIDSSGNILTTDANNTNVAFELGLGGQLLGVSDLANIYDSIGSSLASNEFNYSLNPDIDLSNTNLSLYYLCAYKYRGTIYGLVQVYVPNCYNKGTVVTTDSFTTYYNGTNTYYSTLQGSFISSGMETFGGGTVNDVSYSNAFYLPSYWWNGGAYFCTLSEFYNTSYERNIINYNGWTYDANLANSISVGDIVSFEKIVSLPSTKQLQFDEDYDYNYIQELEESLNNTDSVPNELFDNSQNISTNNYPLEISVPSNTPISTPSNLPFPSNNNNVEPSPNPDPILDYGALTQPSNESILESFSNLQIPFLQNIRYRFPFCIPWDIRDAISLLKFSPTAPAWDFDWKITVLGTTYKYHCVGDLSDFDDLAILFRRLMLCAVFIGLAFWTYKLLL